MKEKIYQVILLIVYTLILMSITGFDLQILFSAKDVFLLLIGILLFLIPQILDRTKWKVLLRMIPMWALRVGIFMSFLNFMTLSTRLENGQEAFYFIGIAFRPAFYGFLLRIFLVPVSSEKSEFFENEKLVGTGQDTETNIQSTLEEWLKVCSITRREKEIVLLISKGHNNTEIADLLFLAESTVKKHVSHILEKTGTKNKEQLKQLIQDQFSGPSVS